jgi:hypothetical protein
LTSERVILVSGVDRNLFWGVLDTFRSIKAACRDGHPDFGFVDFGLTDAQRDELRAIDPAITIVDPPRGWSMDLPPDLRAKWHPRCGSKMYLREYFPDYEVYLWFDADAWAQDARFIDAYVEGAIAHGIAWSREDEPTYHTNWEQRRWWYGNLVHCFGWVDGLRLALQSPANNGILCLHRDAPHWEIWQRLNERIIKKTGKFNMGQHTLHACVHLEGLDSAFIPARYNWICTLATPVWNPERKVLCKDYAPYEPLSVVHLAGHQKDRPYSLKTTDGQTVTSPLTYAAIQALAAGKPLPAGPAPQPAAGRSGKLAHAGS